MSGLVVIVVAIINRTREKMDDGAIETSYIKRFLDLPLKFVFFSRWQEAVSSRIDRHMVSQPST